VGRVANAASARVFDGSQQYYVVDNVQQSDRGGWRIKESLSSPQENLSTYEKQLSILMVL